MISRKKRVGSVVVFLPLLLGTIHQVVDDNPPRKMSVVERLPSRVKDIVFVMCMTTARPLNRESESF